MVKNFGSNQVELSDEIVVHHIFSHLDPFTKFQFSGVCKGFRNIAISNESCYYWKSHTFEFCIDSYCSPLCPLKKPLASASGALSILRNIPFSDIRMHGFVTNIPDCLISLSKKGTVESLQLTVSNKANSPPLCKLLPHPETLSSKFPKLSRLVFDSAHLQHINPEGRYRLLQILGVNLEYLAFTGLSPVNMFKMLHEHCPKLQKLRVDKATSLEDLLLYKNDTLESLELRRPNFLITTSLHLLNLKQLRLTPNCRYEMVHFDHMIRCLPLNLTELDIEVPSDLASDLLSIIGATLHKLLSLKLEGSYVTGKLQVEGLTNLALGCPLLESFEVTSIKSVTSLGFEGESLRILSTYPSLHTVRVMYEDSVLSNLTHLLSHSTSIKNIILWERKRWSPYPWSEMLQELEVVSSQFPTISVTLQDVSCS